MLYFRITVSPSRFVADDSQPREATAHVMIDAGEIQEAAARVVRRLREEKWSIVDVEMARIVHADERFRGDLCMARALAQAEATGFAFYVESPISAMEEGGVFANDVDSELSEASGPRFESGDPTF
jgi:hypothetical protein